MKPPRRLDNQQECFDDEGNFSNSTGNWQRARRLTSRWCRKLSIEWLAFRERKRVQRKLLFFHQFWRQHMSNKSSFASWRLCLTHSRLTSLHYFPNKKLFYRIAGYAIVTPAGHNDSCCSSLRSWVSVGFNLLQKLSWRFPLHFILSNEKQFITSSCKWKRAK